jgi:2-polyprenyl-6-methoxyphenol hydroxylase-like FAD-dependent oxidoreductase
MAATREVLIVGGGPTGVVLGMLLGDFGIDVLVVDKRPRISPLPRARGIHARAAEILRQLGIADDMVAAALPVRPALEVRGPLTEPPVAVVPTGGEGFVEVSPSEGIAIAQDRFESVLRQHLTRRSTVELRPGVGATELSLEEGGSGAVVTLTETASGRTSTVRAEYVVGADGWRSDIRRGLGVPFLGEEHLARLRGVFFRADLRPWLGDPPPAFIQLTHVPGILLSTHPDHRWATMRLTGPDGAGPKVPEALIREHLGVDVPVEVLGDTTFSVGVQWAETLQRGRVLLAGDAAHRVTPQGAGGDQRRHGRRPQPRLEARRLLARVGQPSSSRLVCRGARAGDAPDLRGEQGDVAGHATVDGTGHRGLTCASSTWATATPRPSSREVRHGPWT